MNPEIAATYGDDPITLLQSWYDEAAPLELNDPDAIYLATSTPDAIPSVRAVLLKEIAADGFKFYTHAVSNKGKDLLSNPAVAFVMHWKSTRKQIRVTGQAHTVSQTESDDYFQTRPRARAIGAWASRQSEPYDQSTDIAEAVALYEDQFNTQDTIPRPPQWKGFRIVPDSIEFWIGHRDRLHTRFIYERTASNSPWTSHWLYP